jgi:hypothetical protein
MKRSLLLFLMPFLVILMEKPSLGAADDKREEPRVGGPCEYHRYDGRAEIISVRKIADFQNQAVEKHEVRFRFIPNEEIKESFVQVEGREFLLEINQSSDLSSNFVEQHGIQIGSVFNGYIHVIVKGTCTPVLFEFPSLASK